jgi:chromosomal replication initiation ATPase DnaA
VIDQYNIETSTLHRTPRSYRVSRTAAARLAQGEIDSHLVQQATDLALGVSQEELLSDCRTRHIKEARHAGMRVQRKLFRTTTQVIGWCWGWRDHTTVLHALSKPATDDDAQIEAIVKALTGRTMALKQHQ